MDVVEGLRLVEGEPGRSLATSHETDCSSCAACSLAPRPEEFPPSAEELLAGWRLALVCMALFLTPVLLAIGGALYFADEGLAGQFVGGLVGLAVGMRGAIAIGRLSTRVNIGIQ